MEYPSNVDDQDINTVQRYPDFYCCYLLQSMFKRQSFYVGSTPNPVRRLRQHNGILNKGGAYRTRKEGTRPWEMIALVYGFPCKIAALQFEHAWQHGYKTHYIKDEHRIVKNKTGGRTIHHKLALVRLLISHHYFNRMDLTVHFFNVKIEDIWNINKFDIGVHGIIHTNISEGALLSLENKDSDAVIKNSEENLKLVKILFTNEIQKAQELCERFTNRLIHGEHACGICDQIIDYTSDQTTKRPYLGFCPSEKCNFVSHLCCLSRYFLDEEQLLTGELLLIPASGKCPECSSIMQWTQVAKYSVMLKALYQD